MKNFLFPLLLLSTLQLIAATGDQTVISVHDSTEIVWYGNYDEIANLPDGSKEYQNITMDFTLGCSDGGCSHWDYTVNMSIGEYTGEIDSTISSIDTIGIMPVVLDTVWNTPFEVIEWYELGRMITPYGNYMDFGWTGNNYGFDDTWNKTWSYDVTMMEPLLHNNVPVRIKFSGWPQNGRGFSSKMQFTYTEGTPTRRVTNIQKIYGGGTYTNSTQFEQDILPSKNINVTANNADFRFIVTGHGQDGEFTPIKYRTLANNTLIREENIWRADCSENTLSPQGGTWVYNRANWCPGDDVEEHWFELSDYVSSGSFDLDVNFDDFTPTSGASYIISGYLFEYEEINRLYDATIDQIVTPNINSEAKNITTTGNPNNYDRYTTTICTNPKVMVKNLGKSTLTYCQIEYGVIGGIPFYYEWNGNLKYGESEEVNLPIMNWNGLNASNPEFYATTSFPNHLVDQFQFNDRKESSFDLPPVFDTGNLSFKMRTNNNPLENSYNVTAANGVVAINESVFTANGINTEQVALSDGCYKLEVYDLDTYFFSNEEGGDGLSWWVNTQNGLESSGYFEIFKTVGNTRLAYFNPDFGRKIEYDFMVGEALNEQTNPPTAPAEPAQEAIEEIVVNGITYYYMETSGLYFSSTNVGSSLEEVLSIKGNKTLNNNLNLYPNPSNNTVNILLSSKNAATAKMKIQNAMGQVIDSKEIILNETVQYDFSNKSKGLYFISFEVNNKKVTRKVTIL
jgi:hypothetical protein